MVRNAALLLAVFLLPAALLPSPALAWHESRAAIDDVRYVNESDGVTFYVDFRIWDHVGYVGAVRIRISDGVDYIDVVRTFEPVYDPAYFRGFSLYVSNARLVTEGAFITRDLHVTVDILAAGGNVLARDGGVMAWALGII